MLDSMIESTCMSTWVVFKELCKVQSIPYYLCFIAQLLCDYTLQIAEQKAYEHWKSNCPELREVESREIQKHVVDQWGKQVDDKQKVCHHCNY